MRPMRPGENGPMRAPTSHRWRDTPTRPQPHWQEDAEVAAWRDHADSAGWRGAQRPRRRPSAAGSAARSLTGSLAAGLLVFAVALVGVQFWATGKGQFGPGVGAVISHLVAAVAALLLQTVGERRRDVVGASCVFGALVLVLGCLWFWWWL